MLERAAERTDDPALINMLDHARIAVANRGPCSLVSLGRPRPFDQHEPVRATTAMAGPKGPLIAWTSVIDDVARVRTLQLDRTLAPASTNYDVTPEATNIASTSLAPADDGAVLVFADTDGPSRGVWAQRLRAEGQAQGTPFRAAETADVRQQPSVTRDPRGVHWVTYTEKKNAAFDVFVRRLQADRLADPVALTSHGSDVDGWDAAVPSLAFAGSTLVLAYVRQTMRENEVVFRSMGSIASIDTGGPPDAGPPRVVSQTKLKASPPSVACVSDICYVAWRNQPSGTHVVAVEATSSEVVWRKTVASAGTDVAVASDGTRVLMTWFDRGRVRVASVGRDGIADTSIVARVYGNLGAPSLAPDPEAGWLLAWTCFEGGQPEVYVARMRCE